jgi:hypothetical protein
LRGQQRGKRPILWRLDSKRVNAELVCALPNVIEEDCLPDPTKAHQQKAFRGPAQPRALNGDLGSFAQIVATD